MKTFQPESEQFVAKLLQSQLELKTYIAALSGNLQETENLLQETNLDIWRKASTYDPTRPFLPWAKTLAKFQVMKFRTKCKREKLLFDDSLLALIPAESPEEESGEWKTALRNCIEKLTKSQKECIQSKYVNNDSCAKIARQNNLSLSAVLSLLYRTRRVLHDCIVRSLRSSAP